MCEKLRDGMEQNARAEQERKEYEDQSAKEKAESTSTPAIKTTFTFSLAVGLKTGCPDAIDAVLQLLGGNSRLFGSPEDRRKARERLNLKLKSHQCCTYMYM